MESIILTDKRFDADLAEEMMNNKLNETLRQVFDMHFKTRDLGYLDFVTGIKIERFDDYVEIWYKTQIYGYKTFVATLKYIILDDERGLKVQRQWGNEYNLI